MHSDEKKRQALVVGAQGVLGSAVARALKEAGWQVTRAGRRPDPASDFEQVDLCEADAVGQVCQGMDLVINTAHHPALNLEREVLRTGGTLLDLVELSMTERRQLEAEVAHPTGLVVLHTGLGGVAYLAIAELLRANPAVDAAEYALTVSAAGAGGPAGADFAHRAITGLCYRATATIPFPKPFGTRRCLEVGGDFDGALRTRVYGTPVRHYMYMHPPALNLLLRGLNLARLIKVLPRGAFAGGSTKEGGLTDEPICEWVGVLHSNERVDSRVVEGRGYYSMTTAATLVFAGAVVGRRRESGIKSIEEVLSLAELGPTLESAGVTVRTPALEAA